MDLDGSRGRRGPLTIEERRRRSDAGLCAYCGAAGHALATCPRSTHLRQARGTYQPLPVSLAPPAGYPYPGYPFLPLGGFPTSHGPFPGPWTTLPNPHAAAAAVADVAAAAAAVDAGSKNSQPSQ